jgi:hypothetical protein
MTLQERQQREIQTLKDEISWAIQEERDCTLLESALEHVTSDPETYFKNIDKEE